MKEIVGYIVVNLIFGMLGAISIGLSDFVQSAELNVCLKCNMQQQCFARKKVFADSNFLSELMLVSYIKVRNYCDYVHKVAIGKVVAYCACCAMLVGILFWSKGYGMTGVVFSVSSIMLLALGIVDWNTQYIPVEYTLVILMCGLIRLFADCSNWVDYVIGLFAVSGFLLLVDKVGSLLLLEKGDRKEGASVIGDGDIKLMAATGLLLGWKLNFLALAIGCISGSVIHLIRMKIKGSGSVLALGPYLSLGVYITMICGEQLISWYLNMLGVKPY